jgi:hypothetical protein
MEQKKGLDDYYQYASDILHNSIKEMDEKELKYNKRLIKKAKHETEAYLKLGLDKFISYKTLILKKNDS